MRLQLFEHNQAAFDAALEMLEATGKAAVVHPTGTGKSYIGFKLCEQFSEKTICWLSPSERIPTDGSPRMSSSSLTPS